jgi:glycosyltransferase involved in cell wall biosynthesis
MRRTSSRRQSGSVFVQGYRNWELLLIDDGSSDASTAIAQRWAKEHPERVRYLERPYHQNRGMSASRNLGVRQRGEYIAFWMPMTSGCLTIWSSRWRFLTSTPRLWWHIGRFNGGTAGRVDLRIGIAISSLCPVCRATHLYSRMLIALLRRAGTSSTSSYSDVKSSAG